MMRIRSVGLVLLAGVLLLLSGCAAFKPPAPLADEAEVRDRRGEPTRIWDNPDGTRTFEYATQPAGHTCWMYTIDKDGRVVEQFDALAYDKLARVEKDMTEAEVARLLGQHRSIQRFPLSGEEVWDWNIENESPSFLATLFNVHFKEGKVVRTSRSYIFQNDRMSFGFGAGRGVSPYWGGGWGWPHGHSYWYPWWGW